MTNKEAATIVERIRYYMEGGECWAPTEFEAMDMAIESLNRQDIPNINVSDMIYRQMAIDALIDEFKRTPTMAIRAKHVIKQLPSTQLIAIASPDNWNEKPKFYPEDWSEIL